MPTTTDHADLLAKWNGRTEPHADGGTVTVEATDGGRRAHYQITVTNATGTVVRILTGTSPWDEAAGSLAYWVEDAHAPLI